MTRGVPINVDALRSLLQAAKEERDYWDEEAHRIMRETGHEPPIVWKSNTRYEQFWSWRNTNKAHKPEGRRGALKALSLVGVKVDDLQGRTLLDNLETHPLVRAIYQHNKKARLVSQYQKWETHFYEDGRVFPQFNLAGTVTNRTLTTDPNVQGTSKHKNLEFRAMIQAPSGKKLLKADWSQQEVRIAAFYSKDPEMLRVYRERDTDVYRRTAEELVGHPVDKEDPERQFAKRIVLGFLYGLGIARYQKNTYKDYGEWFEEDEAQEHRNAFRRAFPEYRRWQQLQGTCCVEIDGEVYEYETQEERFTTRSRRGRRRYVKPDSESKPKFTDLINGPIQTTGADILYVALGRLRDDQERGLFTRCRFILSSHDEILLEVPDDEEGRAAKNWLSGHMSDVLEEILSSELGGEECVEALLVDDWSQQKEKKEEVAA
jgi:DNA polymerase I